VDVAEGSERRQVYRMLHVPKRTDSSGAAK
jgi:hypothetical protein